MEINVTTTDLVSVQQVATALQKPRITIYRWVKAQKVASIKLGGIIYIPKGELDKLKVKYGIKFHP